MGCGARTRSCETRQRSGRSGQRPSRRRYVCCRRVRVLQTGKADCGSVEDACAALGERMEAVGRQLAPLPPLVGANCSSLQQLLARFDMLEPRGDKTCTQLAEAQ
eukprot:scaffold46767_cov61-Phaeocystis_antarctica.AAC.3